MANPSAGKSAGQVKSLVGTWWAYFRRSIYNRSEKAKSIAQPGLCPAGDDGAHGWEEGADVSLEGLEVGVGGRVVGAVVEGEEVMAEGEEVLVAEEDLGSPMAAQRGWGGLR